MDHESVSQLVALLVRQILGWALSAMAKGHAQVQASIWIVRLLLVCALVYQQIYLLTINVELALIPPFCRATMWLELACQSRAHTSVVPRRFPVSLAFLVIVTTSVFQRAVFLEFLLNLSAITLGAVERQALIPAQTSGRQRVYALILYVYQGINVANVQLGTPLG